MDTSKSFFSVVFIIGTIIGTCFLIIVTNEIRDFIPSDDITEQLSYIHDFENANGNYQISCLSLTNQSLLFDYDNFLSDNQTEFYNSMINYTFFENGSLSNVRSFDISNTTYYYEYFCYTYLIGNVSDVILQFSFNNLVNFSEIEIFTYEYNNLTSEDIDTQLDIRDNHDFDEIIIQDYVFYDEGGSNPLVNLTENQDYIVQYEYVNTTLSKMSVFDENLTRLGNNEYEILNEYPNEYMYICIVSGHLFNQTGIVELIGIDNNANEDFYNFSCYDFTFNRFNLYNTYQLIHEYESETTIRDFTLQIVSDSSTEFHVFEIEIDENYYYNQTLITELPIRDFDIIITSFSLSANFTLLLNVTIDYGFETYMDDFANEIVPPIMIVGFCIGLIYIYFIYQKKMS